EGWSERWDTVTWEAVLNTSPYDPFRVGTLAADSGDSSESLLILTPDTLSLTAAVGTSDTTWSISSYPAWTTNTESFPRRILWEGEEVRLTACASGITDTFTRSTSNGWGTSDSGTAWTVLEGTTGDFSTNGSAGVMSHSSITNHRISVPVTAAD